MNHTGAYGAADGVDRIEIGKTMMDDKTGWLVVWNGGPLLPPRDSNPSDVWASPISADTNGRQDKKEFSADLIRTSKRKYSRTGNHIRSSPCRAGDHARCDSRNEIERRCKCSCHNNPQNGSVGQLENDNG